ncbi:MAG: DUF692 domain-containing protein [Hyphomicrobiales bacterium]|nr:DUF692 domain-containing protein [Hyphomicrobiales bacterium]
MSAALNALGQGPHASKLPQRGGLGLKPEHFQAIAESAADVGFFEVHAENYMGAGGPPHRWLTRLRADYPLSVHGVGLSIGGSRPLDPAHLRRLRDVIARYQPQAFSEHLAWSTHESGFFNDLLPLPYNNDTLRLVCAHIDEVQTALGRRMLLENPSGYLGFAASTWSETGFLGEIVKRTGCGLLLDINNVHVSATNLDFDARAYLAQFPMHAVGEIHLAGHSIEADEQGYPLLIDTHDRPVIEEVWRLYAEVVETHGPFPTLIERDADIPAFEVLLAEAQQAEAIMSAARLEAGGSVHATMG